MDEMKIRLSLFWVALMLTYLLGDVLRIFAEEFRNEEIQAMKMKTRQRMYLGIAVFMSLPILMVVLSMMLDNPLNRWMNLIVSAVFFLFNLVGLPTYKSNYDRFLIVAGLVINVVIFWQAWQWL
jgi:divalent metal cation (Fe/Co/Zn/Cd) transporter